MPKLYPEHYPHNEKMFRIVMLTLDLASFFLEVATKSQELSEIKPPFDGALFFSLLEPPGL